MYKAYACINSVGSKGELSPLPKGRGYSEPFARILTLRLVQVDIASWKYSEL